DEKVLAVPVHAPLYQSYHTLSDAAPHFLREVEHFFAIYKELEGEKTEILGWEAEGVESTIESCRARYRAACPSAADTTMAGGRTSTARADARAVPDPSAVVRRRAHRVSQDGVRHQRVGHHRIHRHRRRSRRRCRGDLFDRLHLDVLLAACAGSEREDRRRSDNREKRAL